MNFDTLRMMPGKDMKTSQTGSKERCMKWQATNHHNFWIHVEMHADTVHMVW